MAERAIHPLLKLALEVGPIAVFFLAYRMAPVPEGLDDRRAAARADPLRHRRLRADDPRGARGQLALTRKLPRMAVITAVVVTIFGGLTLILRDDTFVKMKPTILYACSPASSASGCCAARAT